MNNENERQEIRLSSDATFPPVRLPKLRKVRMILEFYDGPVPASDEPVERASAPDTLENKTCVDCGQPKPKVDFWRNKDEADGREKRCKTCSKRRRAKQLLASLENETTDNGHRDPTH